MQYFKKSSDFITGQLYPTLSFSIPAYSYLLTMLNTVISNEDTSVEIKNGAKEAKKKILEYYPTSNGQVYIVATGWFNYKVKFISITKFKLLILII
jgi:hypothetical protein